MPYSIGEKGAYGCSGYPVVKDGSSEVMGCHDSMEAAQRQIAAINMSEAEKGKKKMTSALGQPEPASNAPSHFNWSTPVRKPERSSFQIGKSIPDIDYDLDLEDSEEVIEKADGYAPTSGMKSAARRALKWKEDGKATGAGTPVGWGRASDIVAGRSMSLSVVKRMYSFFSRHEVDKKGKGFYSGPEFPSKGRVMWDAWGGDAGFSWSRKIAERESKKSDNIFDFGSVEDLKAEHADKFVAWLEMRAAQSEIELVEKADSVRVGQMVSWNSSGGTARGKVKRVITSGSYKVPGTDVTVTGTPEDPAAVITLYRDGEATDTIVAHKVKTLRAS
jgi:hypothetical protein